MITIRKLVFFTLLSAIAVQAGAWTLFGSKEDALADKLSSGDKYLQKADAAYEDGNMERAGKYYGRAIQKYEQLNAADPTYMDGIAGLRLSYCAKQYTNALEAIETALGAAGADEVGAANAAEVGAAGVAEVEAAGAAEASPPQAAQAAQPQAAQPPQPQAAQAAQPQAAQPPQPPPKPPYDPRNFAHDFAEARMLMEDGNPRVLENFDHALIFALEARQRALGKGIFGEAEGDVQH